MAMADEGGKRVGRKLSNKEWNPLNMIPSALALRKRVASTEVLLERLRILLEVAERLELVEDGEGQSHDKST